MATLLSARTKDGTTAAVCRKLFAVVKTPDDLARLAIDERDLFGAKASGGDEGFGEDVLGLGECQPEGRAEELLARGRVAGDREVGVSLDLGFDALEQLRQLVPRRQREVHQRDVLVEVLRDLERWAEHDDGDVGVAERDGQVAQAAPDGRLLQVGLEVLQDDDGGFADVENLAQGGHRVARALLPLGFRGEREPVPDEAAADRPCEDDFADALPDDLQVRHDAFLFR